MVLRDERISLAVKLFRQAFGEYKWQILALALLGFVAGLLEGVGVNALIPLFSFAVADEAVGGDIVSQAIKGIFGLVGLEFNVLYLLFFISTLFVLKAFLSICLEYIQAKISAGYELKTRQELLKISLGADWQFLTKQKSGYLETILMIDVYNSSVLLNFLGAVLVIISGLVVYILIAINISVVITLITLILGAILLLVIKPLSFRTKKLIYSFTETNKETNHHINEMTLGAKTIKSLLASSGIFEKGNLFFKKISDIRVKVSLFRSTSGAFVQPVSLIFICFVFAFSYRSPGFSLAALAVVVYLIQRIFIYIQQLQKNLHSINELIPHLRSVLDYHNQAAANPEVDTGKDTFVFTDRLKIKQLDFSYRPDKKILDAVDFSVAKGELVGIIGPSGVGKTTLVDLLLRLFSPSAGEILLDSKDISKISLASWRKNVGYVSQDIFLTNDTIANNIRFYNPAITAEQITQAAKMASIYDFIQTLPEGFNFNIGDRGLFLSVGQRQRIAIARVLARQPQLLILDEATSALDNESELAIQQVLNDLRGKITIVLIAHRLSTVMGADRLVVLGDGKVQEVGSPAELLKQKESYFFKVYNLRT